MAHHFRDTRPLLGRPALLGLTAAVGVAFAALVPLGHERQERARRAHPDLLTLSYLQLELEQNPEDERLRLRLTERMLAAGQLERAREVLEPAFARSLQAHPDAEMLRAEIDYRAWAAIPAHLEDARVAAFVRLVQTLKDTDHERLGALQAERIAHFCAEAGLSQLRARIAERLARVDLADDVRLAAADAAHLAAGEPMEAANLYAERALLHAERDGARYAALALERALAAEQPGAAVVLWRTLRESYAHEPRVLELGLGVLAGVDDVEALGLARALLARRPHDRALARRIADLTRWTASPRGRGIDASPRLVSAAPGEPLRWSVELPELSAAPEGSDALALAELLESLGAPERALQTVNGALARGAGADRSLWDLRLGIELRLGDARAALATLQQVDERFGATRQSRERRVDLLLALGETEAALAALHETPEPGDVEHARRISRVAWELGELSRVRAAYRTIAESPEATAHDVRRAWLLEREAGDFGASTRAALSGLARFGDPDFSRLALDSALAAGDDRLVGAVLRETEQVLSRLVRDADHLRLHVTLRHARAYQALRAQDTDAARRELGESARLLGMAARHAEDLGSAYPELSAAQEKQLFELALSSGDHALLARTYPAAAKRLTPRERVFVLHRMQRDTDAVSEAVAGIESGSVRGQDVSALQDEAAALSADMPRQVLVLGDVLEMEGLTAVRAGAAAQWSFEGGERLGARAELTRLGSWDAPSVYLAGRDELAAELSGGIGASELGLGVVAMDGRDPRPFARWSQGLYQADTTELALLLRLNDRSRETPTLRVTGVEDELSAWADVQLGANWSAFARAGAKAYSDRDRDYLGAGVNVDGWLGKSWQLPRGAGQFSTRVAAYAAPRFAEVGADAAMPDSTAWAGLGATLSRGQLSVAPVAGRRLSLLADVSAGWLLPSDQLGWSGKLGVGVSVIGADQLSIAGSASNVLSPVTGFAVYTLAADYAISQW